MDNSSTSLPSITEREKELTEKLGSRILLIWLLVFVGLMELLVIVHLAR